MTMLGKILRGLNTALFSSVGFFIAIFAVVTALIFIIGIPSALLGKEPLTMTHLVLLVFVGWTLPYTNMLIFFTFFKRRYAEEYSRGLDGDGFTGRILSYDGPLRVHAFVSYITANKENQFSNKIVIYANVCRFLNWVWLLLLVWVLFVHLLLPKVAS